MKPSLPIFFAIVTSVLAAIPVTIGNSGAAVSVWNGSDMRIYHQLESQAIREIRVGAPTAKLRGDNVISNGPTLPYTPLAAVSWSEDNGVTTQIRVYYVTRQHTLGEVAFRGTEWNKRNDLKIGVHEYSALLYAVKLGQVLIVGYTDVNGTLSEAYSETDGTNPWKTYTL